MKHIFIIDPKPFLGQQWKIDGLLDSIGQYFRTQRRPNFSTLIIKYSREAMHLIQDQINETEKGELVRVYAVGGDKIVFDCLNGIAGLPNTELAIMPHGITNNFIRSFGDDNVKLFNDIQSIVSSPAIPTDIIEAGNNYAINGCAVGFFPAINTKMVPINAKIGKGIGIMRLMTSLAALFNKEIVACQYKISIDGNDYSGHYSLIMVANGTYFGQKKIALPDVLPDDGFLDVILFKSAGIVPTLWSFWSYSFGKVPSNGIRLQAKKIIINSDMPMWIQTDSEYFLDTRIALSIIPGAVRVVSVNNLTYLTYQRFQR